MGTMGQELTKNIQFARENKGGTWVGQKMLGTEESDHIACANMYLVAVERLIKLEDQLEDHKTELEAMVRLVAGEGRAPRKFFVALDKLLEVGRMAMRLLENYHGAK